MLFLCFYFQNGNTALHYAAKYGHIDLVKMLHISHVELNVINKVSRLNIYTPKKGSLYSVFWAFSLMHNNQIACVI